MPHMPDYYCSDFGVPSCVADVRFGTSPARHTPSRRFDIPVCVSSDGTEVLTQLYCGAPCARPALQQKAARRGGLGIAALFMLLQLLAGEFDDAVILQTFGDVPDDLLAVG